MARMKVQALAEGVDVARMQVRRELEEVDNPLEQNIADVPERPEVVDSKGYHIRLAVEPHSVRLGLAAEETVAADNGILPVG